MILCVTGKMASGKNFFCSVLEENGFVSIDADKCVHSIISDKTETILKEFLPVAESLNKTEFKNSPLKIQNADGSLNRKELGRLLFSDKKFLEKQESIIYPELILRTKEFILKNSQKNIILNATVLYKIPELLNLCSKIIFVEANPVLRLIRAKKRDKIPFKQIKSRFDAQKNLFQIYKSTKIPVIKFKNSHGKTKTRHFIKKFIRKIL